MTEPLEDAKTAQKSSATSFTDCAKACHVSLCTSLYMPCFEKWQGKERCKCLKHHTIYLHNTQIFMFVMIVPIEFIMSTVCGGGR